MKLTQREKEVIASCLNKVAEEMLDAETILRHSGKTTRGEIMGVEDRIKIQIQEDKKEKEQKEKACKNCDPDGNPSDKCKIEGCKKE